MIDTTQNKDELRLNFLDNYLREADTEDVLNRIENAYIGNIRVVIDEMMYIPHRKGKSVKPAEC